mmetsp:Transcript_14252/g.24369  ORF Transcript_14252/g.24369 Transcript_14252/m.24369 type:complete len:85 (+) Transcript_14252:201-455(+)
MYELNNNLHRDDIPHNGDRKHDGVDMGNSHQSSCIVSQSILMRVFLEFYVCVCAKRFTEQCRSRMKSAEIRRGSTIVSFDAKEV